MEINPIIKNTNDNLMFFKLSYSIRNFFLNKDEEIFNIEGDDIEIRYFRPSENDFKRGTKYDTVYCDAIAQITPKEKNFIFLNKILGRQELNIQTDEKRGTTIKVEDNHDYFIPHIDGFPQYFKDFYRKTNEELSSAIKTITNNVMWVYNYNGTHNPYSTRSFQFSKDKVDWEDMPLGIQVRTTLGNPAIQISDNGRKIISSKEKEMPIHHSLFLEAWGLKSLNQRSSLIMGLAALESAVKHMVVKVVPDSEWLIENTSSPSLVSMLRDMLKTLPIKNKIDGEIKPLSKSTIDDLMKWVKVRNVIIHKGTTLPISFDLNKILKTIKSIIYLMDYYGGEEWAIYYVYKDIVEDNR